jgi:MoxR-like ATPase
LGEVHKANSIVRSLVATVENDRVSADRFVFHLQALDEYRESIGKRVLTPTDIKTLYETRRDIERPEAEMQDITGPSADQSLTSQSLSFNGFSESDSDYIP